MSLSPGRDFFTPRIMLSFHYRAVDLVLHSCSCDVKQSFYVSKNHYNFFVMKQPQLNISLLCPQGNMDQFAMLLDHDADPSIGLARSGRNLLHMLATGCTEHDLRKFMKIVLKKV